MTQEKRYVTFGQVHVHSVNGKTFDKDCVAIVYGSREDVFEIFGDKFCFEYTEDTWNPSDIDYYSRGYIEVEKRPEEEKPKTSHTPGPWSRNFIYTALRFASKQSPEIIDLWEETEEHWYPDYGKDVNLIAAAPDMLEALRMVEMHLPEFGMQRTHRQVKRAIDKAEGKNEPDHNS